MFKRLFLKGGLLCLLMSHFNVSSTAYNYIYPNQEPSMSNYGTVGLLSNPTARFYDEGTLVFAWNRMQPYLRGTILATPFDGFEASYQYTDINNQLYSQFITFSGKQSFKDKSFDAKFRLFKETEKLPQIAVGFRDFAGTGLFSSEYFVGSKKFGSIDFTLGLGWGKMSHNNLRNPFSYINDSFDTRSIVEGTKGGEFSFGSFFSGDMSPFGGLEVFLPYMNGSRLKIEYDSVNYSTEGFPPVIQDKKINIGFVYPVSKRLQLKAGFIRGNTINFGFSYSGNYASKEPFIPKNDPYKPVPYPEIVKNINSQDKSLLYKSAIKYLAENEIFLQAADYDEDSKTLKVAYSQNKHISYPRAAGRAVRVLDEISPYGISHFKLNSLNADMGQHSILISRDKYNRYKNNNLPHIHLNKSSVSSYKHEFEDYDLQPVAKVPQVFWKFAPNARYQIGGPDGFFFGDLRLAFQSETILRKGITIDFDMSAGLIDNLGELKLASDSVLPHVRTEIVQYLKQGKHFSVDRFQINSFHQISPNLYTKLSGGYLEQMFAGVGGEILYRPFYKSWALGAELWHARQRDFNMRLGLQDYNIETGFINFYYHHNPSKILFKIKGGRFLANDSGFNFDFSRRFKSGAVMGIFFSLTDISRAEFGEGSFDKGFYFFIPIESFFTNYSTGDTGFGLKPVTRDGAAIIDHSFSLYSVTDKANFSSITRDWDDIYD